MAGVAAINVIGVISGLLGIYQFGADNFGKADEGGSVVRVQVGLDYENGLSNSGGDLPDIRLFNEVGEFLGGSYDPGHTDQTVCRAASRLCSFYRQRQCDLHCYLVDYMAR